MAEFRQIAKPSSSCRHAASCQEAIRSGGAAPATQSYTGTSNALPAITVTAPRIREAEPTDAAITRRVPLRLRHPDGDELVYAVDGEATLQFIIAGGTQSVHVDPGKLALLRMGDRHLDPFPKGVTSVSITPRKKTGAGRRARSKLRRRRA